MLEPEKWVDNFGDELYRFALSRLNAIVVAEDVVQDTFLSAWRSRSSYNGTSSERNWLFAICKNKIIDHFRKSKKSIAISAEPYNDVYFNEAGHWIDDKTPKDWHTGSTMAMDGHEFNTVLQGCQNKLKELQRNVFVLKYLEELETEQICQVLDITTSNFWVLIHRCKLQLRACLEKNWFNI